MKLSKHALVSIAKNAFPEMKFQGKSVLAEGWDYSAVIFDNKYVVRIPKDEDAKHRAPVDFCLLGVLQDMVPARLQKPLLFNAVENIALYEAVSGTPVSVNRYRKFSPRQKADYAKKVAEFITALHATPVAIVKKCRVPVVSPRRHEAEVQISLNACLAAPLDKNLHEALKLFKLRRKTVSKKFVATLIHSDLGDEHIFSGKTSKDRIGIIDFSDACIDDPAREFFRLYCHGEKFVSKVIAHYGGRIDEGFVERSRLYRIEEAVKVLSMAIKEDSSMTLVEAKKFLAESLN